MMVLSDMKRIRKGAISSFEEGPPMFNIRTTEAEGRVEKEKEEMEEREEWKEENCLERKNIIFNGACHLRSK